MKALKTNKVFFSVYRLDRSNSENLDNHNSLKVTLDAKKISYTEVLGSYKGQRELSFVFESTNRYDHESQVNLALQIAADFKQESILIVDNEDVASLVYLGSDIEDKIGKFTVVESTKGLDAYSVIGERIFSIV